MATTESSTQGGFTESHPPVWPNVGEVRAKMPESGKIRSTAKGLTVFFVAAVPYLLALAGALFSPWWTLRLVCAVLTGIMISIFFVVGHDACHGSLTPINWLNKLLARLALLPSLHGYAFWELGHNRIHHGWTNLKGKDHVWTPFSKEEFDRLPAYRQRLERWYRTPLGLALYYFIEMWWKHMVAPPRSDIEQLATSKLTALGDWLMTIGYAVLQCMLFAMTASLVEPEAVAAGAWWPAAVSIAIGFVLPYAIWNFLMGFVIYQHHTHPSVAWYADRKMWDFFQGQIQGTVHVVFPWPVGPLSANIMEHSAHHANPKIPLYNLAEAQRSLENAFREDVVVQVFNPPDFKRTLATCQLYDYENYRWLNFDGEPTTECNLPRPLELRPKPEPVLTGN
jgi:omega-6 fatty acid desaturase (delta-12 desaturase)